MVCAGARATVHLEQAGVCVAGLPWHVCFQSGLLRRARKLWRVEATACHWRETHLRFRRLRTRKPCMVVPG